jgi:hypothetical protein
VWQEIVGSTPTANNTYTFILITGLLLANVFISFEKDSHIMNLILSVVLNLFTSFCISCIANGTAPALP